MGRSLSAIISLAILISSSPLVSASRVVSYSAKKNEIVITQDKEKNWIATDQVCVVKNSQEVACGEVTQATKKKAVVKISRENGRITHRTVADSRSASYVEVVFGKQTIHKGDSVEKMGPETAQFGEGFGASAFGHERRSGGAYPNLSFMNSTSGSSRDISGRRPASLIGEDSLLAGKDDLFLASDLPTSVSAAPINPGLINNMSVGLSYIFPFVQYQRAINDYFAVGAMHIYMNTPVGNGNVNGVGAFVTANYYGVEAFHGMYGQVGLGMYSLHGSAGSNSDSFSSLAVEGTFGYRWFWNTGINFGFGVGLQYLLTKQPPNVTLDFSGVLPSVALDLGYAF